MRSAVVLALLLCAGQVIALPVNSPMDTGDTEVMKCIVEVISDTLSKPSPVPVSQECFETLRGDERILSILRHQNLLKELQDLALQGAKERAPQQKHSRLEDELAEVLEKQNHQAELKEVTEEALSEDAAEARGDSKEVEKNGEDADGARPQAALEPEQESRVEDAQAPGEEKEAINTHSPTRLPSQKHPDPQAEGDSDSPSQGLVDREKGLGAERGQQAKREEEEDEAGEKADAEEEGPTAAFNPHPSLSYKIRKGESWSEALAVDGARKTGAEEAQPPEGQGEREHSRQEEEEEEETAGASRGLFRGGKSRELEQEKEQERLSKEWEDAKRWSKMDQLAKELTAVLPGGQHRGGPAPAGARLPGGEERGGRQRQPQTRGPGAGEPVGHRGGAGEGGPPAAGAAAGLRRHPATPARAPRHPVVLALLSPLQVLARRPGHCFR
uniref:Chromogranin-A n=1 Tax=Equus caballus TaxID=9796 RepID=A0A9L0SY19_HORSE